MLKFQQTKLRFNISYLRVNPNKFIQNWRPLQINLKALSKLLDKLTQFSAKIIGCKSLVNGHSRGSIQIHLFKFIEFYR